jgi:hypothetical protein
MVKMDDISLRVEEEYDPSYGIYTLAIMDSFPPHVVMHD